MSLNSAIVSVRKGVICLMFFPIWKSNGTLEKKLTVQCSKVSKSAQAAIEKVGGKVEVI